MFLKTVFLLITLCSLSSTFAASQGPSNLPFVDETTPLFDDDNPHKIRHFCQRYEQKFQNHRDNLFSFCDPSHPINTTLDNLSHDYEKFQQEHAKKIMKGEHFLISAGRYYKEWDDLLVKKWSPILTSKDSILQATTFDAYKDMLSHLDDLLKKLHAIATLRASWEGGAYLKKNNQEKNPLLSESSVEFR